MMEINGKYNRLYIIRNRCRAYTGFASWEDITDDILCAKLLDSDSRTNSWNVNTSTIIAAVLGGLVGVIGSALFTNRNVTATFRVYMTDGSSFEITTDDREVIEFLKKYIVLKRRR